MGLVDLRTGVRLYVEDFGEGHPVIFVHGGGVTHAFWEHQVAGLVRDFRTITYDLRGCGASDKPAGTYSVDIWARDLHALIEELQLESPTVIGHALGSHVLLRLQTLYPGTAGRAVLAAAAPWFSGEHGQAGGFAADFWQQLQASWMHNRPQAELDLADTKYFLHDPGEGIRMAVLQMALTWPLPVFLELAKTLPDLDHREALAAIDLPVLLMHGRHDEKNRYEGVGYLHDHIKDSRLVTFDESAHCLPIEEPERFTAEIRRFLGTAP